MYPNVSVCVKSYLSRIRNILYYTFGDTVSNIDTVGLVSYPGVSNRESVSQLTRLDWTCWTNSLVFLACSLLAGIHRPQSHSSSSLGFPLGMSRPGSIESLPCSSHTEPS